MTPRTFIVNSLLLARQSRFQSARSRKAIKTPGAQLFLMELCQKLHYVTISLLTRLQNQELLVLSFGSQKDSRLRKEIKLMFDSAKVSLPSTETGFLVRVRAVNFWGSPAWDVAIENRFLLRYFMRWCHRIQQNTEKARNI